MDRELELLLLQKKVILLKMKRRQERRQRRWWVRPVFVSHKEEGLYYTAMRRMRDGDHDFFFKFYRMSPRLGDVLLSFVKEDLTRQHVVREPLEPGERLAIALRLVTQ